MWKERNINTEIIGDVLNSKKSLSITKFELILAFGLICGTLIANQTEYFKPQWIKIVFNSLAIIMTTLLYAILWQYHK